MTGSGSADAEPVVVVGAGLTAGLIALALARRGLAVMQVAPCNADPTAATPTGSIGAAGRASGPLSPPGNATGPARSNGSTAQTGQWSASCSATSLSATSLSYGSLSLGSSGREWRRLERLHGPLGFSRCGLKLHDQGWLGRRLTLAASRVDALTLMAALPKALAAMGVQRLPALVQRLEPGSDATWRLHLADPLQALEPRGVLVGVDSPPPHASILEARQVVLAAGAGCLELWPPLAEQLSISWAGVLALEINPGANPWLEQVARGRLVLNRTEERIALENQAGALKQERWIVDTSAAPWGPKGVLVGQISLVQPLDGGHVAPDPVPMEMRLRQGLSAWDPHLAALEAPYRQTPVVFGLQGQALVGPVPEAAGLWTFTGFRSPFSTAPQLAETLAQRLAAKVFENGNLE